MLYALMTSLLFATEYVPQNGDIVFQTSLSSQSKAIQIATDSPYSHVGIVYLQQGEAYVFEAIKTVRLTPFQTWVERGEGNKITVMRTKRALSAQQLQAMKSIGEQYRGKAYDLAFQWSDDQMYCSELVWKIYEEGANITLTKPNPFGEYNFTAPEVYPLVKKRWGSEPNLSEKVVAPSDIASSKRLKTVYTDFKE